MPPKAGQSSRRSTASTQPSQDSTQSVQESSSGVDEQARLQEEQNDIEKILDEERSDEELRDVDNADWNRIFNKAKLLQNKSYSYGQQVGIHGDPSRMVQDARLNQRIGEFTIRPIKLIKVTKTVWKSSEFSSKLRKFLALRSIADFEDVEEDDEEKPIYEKQYLVFVEEFGALLAPGNVPYLSVVHGARTALVVKSKPKTQTQNVRRTQKEKSPAEKSEKPQKVKKMKASEMNETVDPTMKKVIELNEEILNAYEMGDRSPVDVMNLLINPTSFHTSVERFFCFSFLLKDRKVRMYLDDSELPVCTPVKIPLQGTPDDEDDEEERMESVPDPTAERNVDDKFEIVMMNLTLDHWKKLVKAYYPDYQGGNNDDDEMEE